jgi:hypothetical protein
VRHEVWRDSHSFSFRCKVGDLVDPAYRLRGGAWPKVLE